MSDGRTHFEGCWRDHHDCAMAQVEDMLEEIRALIEEKERRDSAITEHLEARMSLTRRVVAAEERAEAAERALADVRESLHFARRRLGKP